MSNFLLQILILFKFCLLYITDKILWILKLNFLKFQSDQIHTQVDPSEYSVDTGMINKEDRAKIFRDEYIAEMLQEGLKIPKIDTGKFKKRFDESAPYHYFFTKVEDAEVTQDQTYSISFIDLLDESIGKIVDSFHINFMIELEWLLEQYILATQGLKMTIFYQSLVDPENVCNIPERVKLVCIEMPSDYGCHHSKISILRYEDKGIRVIISTANLYASDWKNRTQGIWISPHLPRLPESSNPDDGESVTEFKKEFLKYLKAYDNPEILHWVSVVERADFSSVNVFFVASVPGAHRNWHKDEWGSRKLRKILTEHAVLPPDAAQWDLIAQASSIGNFGPTYRNWLLPSIVAPMTSEKNRGSKAYPNLKFIYPTIKNYEDSWDGAVGSSCFPYNSEAHEKQRWLNNYMYQWKFDETGRTKAMPHIKSYTRISPDMTKIPWFVLTSANLSKSAWGTTDRSGRTHYISNYEAGVVFIPQFVIKEDTFPIKESEDSNAPIFRLPYDLPLTPYSWRDDPFARKTKPDEEPSL